MTDPAPEDDQAGVVDDWDPGVDDWDPGVDDDDVDDYGDNPR